MIINVDELMYSWILYFAESIQYELSHGSASEDYLDPQAEANNTSFAGTSSMSMSTLAAEEGGSQGQGM